MPLTNDGAEFLQKCFLGEAVTPFDVANTYLGVSPDDTAFDPTQSDLGTTSEIVLSETGYPQASGNTITIKAIFGTDQANFDWNSWGVLNAQTGGILFNRLVEDNGRKEQGHTWEITVELNFGN